MASTDREKADSGYAGDLVRVYTQFEHDQIANLSPEHRQYLLDRHGNLELDPVPDMSDSDPYNWTTSKKCINLALVAFHAFISTFAAASIQSAFVNIAEDLEISIEKASYLVSLQIAILGGARLLWRPFSNRYGRRPNFLVSLICAAFTNIGCATSYSYATMALNRALVAFFISPPLGIGSAVSAECFFKKDRARAMGVWTLLSTIGVLISPFIFGFVALRVSCRWIYYILAITTGVQLVLYTFLEPETRYIRSGVTHPSSNWRQKYFNFIRFDPTPFRLWDFVQPLSLAARPCVMLPAASYAMVFLFGVILLMFEVPLIFPEDLGFNPQQVGLQFISLLIGSIIGEQVGEIISDQWMLWRAKRLQRHPRPESRLWLSYLEHLLTICGIVVFLIQTKDLESYKVSPMVGAAIAAGGNQIVTTVMTTYAVDCYKEDAASIGFIGPFWFPQAIEALGFGGLASLAAGLLFGASILPTILLQLKGRR